MQRLAGSRVVILNALAALFVLSEVRAASYQATLLYPQGSAFLVGGSASSQVGYSDHALLWHGTPESVVDLHPAGYSNSRALAASETSQIGQAVRFDDSGTTVSSVLLWHGTAESVVDLTPSGYVNPYFTGVSSTTQVGNAALPGSPFPRALLWHGTADGVVDLTPSNYALAVVNGVSGNVQFGRGVRSNSGYEGAVLWRGTAESIVDLHPPGWDRSEVLGGSDSTQVGTARFSSGGEEQAFLWRGTAASGVNLNTPGELWYSKATAASETIQVGYGHGPNTGGLTDHALRWRGTPESMVNLHSFLQPLGIEFTLSYATSVDAEGNIFGWAYEGSQNRPYPIKWTPVPEPNAFLLTLSQVLALLGVRRR